MKLEKAIKRAQFNLPVTFTRAVEKLKKPIKRTQFNLPVTFTAIESYGNDHGIRIREGSPDEYPRPRLVPARL